MGPLPQINLEITPSYKMMIMIMFILTMIMIIVFYILHLAKSSEFCRRNPKDDPSVEDQEMGCSEVL